MKVMKIAFTFAVFASLGLVAAATTSAQDPYAPLARPAAYGAPLPSNVTFQHHRSTEYGDAVDALSLLVDAQGRAFRNRSEGVINLQYAERLRLQNLIEREQAKLEIEQRRAQLASLRHQRQQLVREIARENRVTLPETQVVSQKGHVLWIEPLRHEAFARDRMLLESQIAQLQRAASLDTRTDVLDRINETCQSLLETLAVQQPAMSTNEYDASTRFVNRLYDDLLQPTNVASGQALTLR
jgi:hypothetical protein